MERNRAIDEARQRVAQSSYEGALANVRAKKEEAKEAVQPYNEAISGILEPLGTAGLHPLAKKLLEKAVKKGAKTVVRAGRTAVSDLAQGNNPLSRVPTLDEVRGRILNTTDNLEGNLSERGRTILNGARNLGGRAGLTQSAPGSEGRTGVPQERLTEEPDNLVPQTAQEGNLRLTDEEPRLVNLADEEPTENADLVDAVANGRMDINEALFRNFMRNGEVPTARGRPANIDPDQPSSSADQQARFRSRLNELGNEPTGSESTDASAPASDGSPPAPTEPQADTSTASTDPAPTEPPAPVNPEETALLEDAGEIEAGGGGPEDPFTDIVAGILSLGAIISGATAKVKPAQVDTQVVNPSVQYGI